MNTSNNNNSNSNNNNNNNNNNSNNNNGWEMKDDDDLPIITDQPDAFIEINLFKCSAGCKTMRCKWNKNQVGCTEMCLCANCENNGAESDKFWSDEEETDDIL